MGKNVAQQTLDALNLDRALRLRVQGANWSEIAAACDFPSPAAALAAVGEAMKEATGRAVETADQMRDTANLQYDALSREAWKLIESEDDLLDLDEETGLPTGPSRVAAAAMKLRAVDEARRLVDSKIKLNRLGMPDKEEKGPVARIEIVGVQPNDFI